MTRSPRKSCRELSRIFAFPHFTTRRLFNPMESCVLLRSTATIRSVSVGAAAMPSSGLVELRRISVRVSRALVPHAEIRSSEGGAVKLSAKTTFICRAQSSRGDLVKPHPEVAEENGSAKETVENVMPVEHQKGAKIHDFCFGIPFGGTVLISGIVAFSIARDVNSLGSSLVFGGALLGLSTTSLKVWRQGNSSFRYIAGQAVIAAILLWHNYQGYLLTKKIFPHTVLAAISAAMLCFYSYVVISGGNPPPKKLKPQA